MIRAQNACLRAESMLAVPICTVNVFDSFFGYHQHRRMKLDNKTEHVHKEHLLLLRASLACLSHTNTLNLVTELPIRSTNKIVMVKFKSNTKPVSAPIGFLSPC